MILRAAYFLSLFSLFCCFSSYALSQSQSGISISGPTILPDLVITARKRDDNTNDVPFGVSVVTGEELDKRQATRGREIIRDVPNVTVTGFEEGRSTNFSIRGVGAIGDPLSPDDTSVVLYQDGVPLPLFASDLSFLDMERVEILRGPQGSLFGRNASGGVINFITKKPAFENSGSLRTEIGTQGHFQSTVVANGTIIPRVVAGRIALRYSEIDGFVENELTANDLGARDVRAGRASLSIKPTARTSIDLSAQFERDDRNFPFFTLRNTPNFPFVSELENTMVRDTIFSSATLTHRFDLFDFTSVTGFTNYKTDIFVDDTEGVAFSQLLGLPRAVFAVNNAFTDWEEERTLFHQEFRLNSRSNDPIAWVAGVSFSHSDFDADYLNENVGFVQLNGRRTNRLITDSYGVFGEFTAPVTERLNWTLGGRLSREDKTYQATYVSNGAPGTVGGFAEAGDLSFGFVTGRTSLSYNLTGEATVYGTVSRGYKTGGFARLLIDAAFGIATEPFGSAKSWSYELGWKHRAADRRFSFDAAIFLNDVSDEHLLTIESSTFTFRPANIDVISYGAEVEGSWQVTPALKLSGAIGYTVAELRNVSDQIRDSVGGRDGNRTPNVPRWTVAAGLEWREEVESNVLRSLAPRLGGAEAFAEARWQHVGSRLADVGNTFTLPAYNLINGRLGLAFAKGMEIYGFGKNLLDEQLQLAGAALAPGLEAVIPGRGRLLGLGAAVRW